MSIRQQRSSYDTSYKEFQKSQNSDDRIISSYPLQQQYVPSLMSNPFHHPDNYHEFVKPLEEGGYDNNVGYEIASGSVGGRDEVQTLGEGHHHHHHHHYYYYNQNHKKIDQGFLEEEHVEQKKEKWWKTMYRSTWFQIIMVGALAFCGPAMADAISGLGGGGAADPWAVNAATSANYAASVIICLFGGPLASRLGVRTLLIIGAATFPINGSSFYVNLKYHLQWYLIAGRAIGGIGTGLWYVAESSILLTYPEDNRRGAMLAFWVMSRNLGQIVGGSINLGRNFHQTAGGTIAKSTFLIFIAIEASGFPISFLISPAHKVKRQDGTSIIINPPKPWKEELRIVWKTLKQSQTLLLSPYFFYSFFYGGVLGTYLTLNFSVRARALSSLIVPVSIVFFVFAFGIILDMAQWSQYKRAVIAFLIVFVPTTASFVWLMINQIHFTNVGHEKLDWTSSNWPNAYLPFLIMQISGYQCQTFIYWLLSCHADDINTNARVAGIFRAIEASGQAISYGLNSRVKTNIIPLAINWGLSLIAIPGCIAVIAKTPRERVHCMEDEETYDD